MRVIYNTSDYFYQDYDVFHFFQHAYNLGRTGEKYNIMKAFEECKREYADNVLKELTLDAITDAVSEATGVDKHYILVDSRRHKTWVLARHLISYFAHVYTRVPLEDVQKYMGYKDHSSVIHGKYVISDGIRFDKKIRGVVDKVKGLLVFKEYALHAKTRTWSEMDTIQIVGE